MQDGDSLMRKRDVRAVLGTGIMAIALLCAMPALAQAPLVEGEQSAATGPMITDPAVIGRCLCAGGRVSTDKAALDTFGGQYAAAKAHAEATAAAVARLRPQVRSDNAEQLDAFRRLVVESQRAENDLYGHVQPAYAAAVTRYNQSVASYNQACAGLPMDKALQTRVAQTLVCPAL